VFYDYPVLLSQQGLGLPKKPLPLSHCSKPVICGQLQACSFIYDDPQIAVSIISQYGAYSRSVNDLLKMYITESKLPKLLKALQNKINFNYSVNI
jgi:hypothetical protein